MRTITITYAYHGDEQAWTETCEAFINAVANDPDAEGFAYQVAVADDGVSRVHWGRWDSASTLAHVQAQAYFQSFSERVRAFAGGPPNVVVADIRDHTSNW